MTILQVDANSAYLSWTAAWLLEKGYPVDIRTVPSVIAGDPDNRHGIILAKSIPAKKAGVGTGASLYEAKEKCPDLLVFPPDYDLYLRASNAMYSILTEYSPLIQRYSVDESFVEFRGSMVHGTSYVKTAYEIKERIKHELGFTVNVGVGANRLLSKMACELEKPDKVHVLLTQADIEQKLWPLDVSELFMVGHATARKLRKLNINTIGDLARSDRGLMRSVFKSHGELIWKYANGIDYTPIVPNGKLPRKSVGNGMTIKYDVTDLKEASMYLLSLTERVGSRLRAHHYKASLISVGVCTSGFLYYSHQVQLPFYTGDTTEIYRYASMLLSECWNRDPIRKLMVRVSGLAPENEYQLTIFDDRDIEAADAENSAVDRIRKRFGERAIYRGTFANSPLAPVEGGVNDGDYIMMGGYGR